MSFTPEEEAMGDRLTKYNGRAYNPVSEPYGFDRGGNQQGVFEAMLKDVSGFGRAVLRVANGVLAAITQKADRFEAAVEAIEAGPVSSVVGRSGIVTADHIKTAIGFDDLADDLTQKVDDALSQIPLFKPITMTVPAANATGLGSGGTYTFVVQAFAGDTIGFYPDYPVPLASRFVNVFEPGGNAPVAVLPVAGSGVAFPVNFTGTSLQTSHAYDFQAGYTDAQGNSVLSQRVRATTAAQFKPGIGQAYEGGFLAFEQFGDGGLFDLVQGPKSLEANRTWNGGTAVGALSRLNGPLNTQRSSDSSASGAARYARSALIGGVASDLAAIDEARAISFKLRPANAPVGSPFVSGGSEAFQDNVYWSSTELNATTAYRCNMFNIGEGASQKDGSFLVRPIKRIAVPLPIAIGTYVAAQGGWLWFYLTDLSDGTPKTYVVFKSDKAVEVTREWEASDSQQGIVGANSRTNGVINMIAAQGGNPGNRGFMPATFYCQNLVHNSKDDWYLGGIDEMLAGYRMNSQLPGAQQLNTTAYWSSTEVDANNACLLNSAGTEDRGGSKTAATPRVVPIRRVLLSALAA